MSATSDCSTPRRSGARSRYTCRMLEKPEMPAAASVLIAPAEIAFTRMFFGPSSRREIPDRGFERGLRHAHHVVVREHALAADVSERQDAAAAALLHQRHHRARQPDERVGADVERDSEAFTRRLHEWLVEIRRRRERSAVHEEIEAAKLTVEIRRRASSICSSLDTSHGRTSGFSSFAASSRTFSSSRSLG